MMKDRSYSEYSQSRCGVVQQRPSALCGNGSNCAKVPAHHHDKSYRYAGRGCSGHRSGFDGRAQSAACSIGACHFGTCLYFEFRETDTCSIAAEEIKLNGRSVLVACGKQILRDDCLLYQQEKNDSILTVNFRAIVRRDQTGRKCHNKPCHNKPSSEV